MGSLCACRGASATDGKHGLVQWGLDYAKGFIEDKLKRPSASDLLVDEDFKLLPKVSLLTCPDFVPSHAICIPCPAWYAICSGRYLCVPYLSLCKVCLLSKGICLDKDFIIDGAI